MKYEEIKEAVEQISMTDDTKKRIVHTDWKRKRICRRNKIIGRSVAAVSAVLLLFAGAAGQNGEEKGGPLWMVRAYAKDEDGEGWVYLKKGQPVQLQKQENQCEYAVEVDLPEKYDYVRTTVRAGEDYIRIGDGGTSCPQESEIENQEQQTFEEGKEGAEQEASGDKADTVCITIIDESGGKADTVTLITTQGEDGAYYLTYASEEETGSE